MYFHLTRNYEKLHCTQQNLIKVYAYNNECVYNAISKSFLIKKKDYKFAYAVFSFD